MRIAMFGQKRIPSREGGVEIVVEELSTRMAVLGHKVTCYNRRGHHVSGSQYDTFTEKEYKNVRIKTVPTIEKKGLAAVEKSPTVVRSGFATAAFSFSFIIDTRL